MSDDKFDYDETGRRPKPTCVCAETSARNCPVHSEPKPAADGAGVREAQEWTLRTVREQLTGGRGTLRAYIEVISGPTVIGTDDWKKLPGHGNPFEACGEIVVVPKSALERSERKIEKLERSAASRCRDVDALDARLRETKERAEKAEAQMREIEWTCGELNAGIVDLRLTLKARERERDDLRAKLAACEEALKLK